jgi:hypothetical protein
MPLEAFPHVNSCHTVLRFLDISLEATYLCVFRKEIKDTAENFFFNNRTYRLFSEYSALLQSFGRILLL